MYKAPAPGHSSLHPKLVKGGVVTLILQMQNTVTEIRGDFTKQARQTHELNLSSDGIWESFN